MKDKYPHLLMFDVDGTLVDTLKAEARCFPLACEQAFGITGINTNWHSYRIPSDSGVVTELIERHFGRSATREDIEKVERYFFALLQQTYLAEPESCVPIAGALSALHTAKVLSNTKVSIATAGWTTTTKLKLTTAGFEFHDVPIASSADAFTKADIMKVSLERARQAADVPEFSSVVYLGDSAGDARAAAAHGFHFIGIDTSGFVSHVPDRFPDFLDFDGVLQTIQRLRS